MNHADHVDLLRDGIPASDGVWADLGAGEGAFTLALAELLGRGGKIIAVDRDRNALARLEKAIQGQYPELELELVADDFSRPLGLPALDGIVMANSLHFFEVKESIVAIVKGYLKPTGRLVVVEYDTDRGNHWVPYPISYRSWENLAAGVAFASTRRLAIKPSSFLGQFYSALSWSGEDIRG